MRHPRTTSETTAISGCRLLVAQDVLQPCPYLPDQTARMPLKLPLGGPAPQVTDWLMDQGYRRSGEFFYRTECPRCQACQPTRIPVQSFGLTESLRRVLRRGDRDLRFRWNRPIIDDTRVALFNRHRIGRHLSDSEEPIDDETYSGFLINAFGCESELSLWNGDDLVAVSIVDVGATCMSAVYTFFDPDRPWHRYSLGTLAIIKMWQRSIDLGLRHLYLGMHVAANAHLAYKARFLPQERLVEGRWVLMTDRPSRPD